MDIFLCPWQNTQSSNYQEGGVPLLAFIYKTAEVVRARIEAFDGFRDRSFRRLLARVPSWFTADHITALRIFCVVPIIYALLQSWWTAAFFFLVFAAILDALDGPRARMLGRVTETGKFLDPFADKLIVFVTLTIIFLRGGDTVPPALFWTVIGADMVLILLSFVGKSARRYELGSNIWGRTKFVLQSVALSAILIGLNGFGCSVLWIAAGFAVLSIIGHARAKNIAS